MGCPGWIHFDLSLNFLPVMIKIGCFPAAFWSLALRFPFCPCPGLVLDLRPWSSIRCKFARFGPFAFQFFMFFAFLSFQFILINCFSDPCNRAANLFITQLYAGTCYCKNIVKYGIFFEYLSNIVNVVRNVGFYRLNPFEFIHVSSLKNKLCL